MNIPPPTLPPGDEDRHLQCQSAIEMAIQEIIAAAMVAGWDEDEIITSIIEVADNQMLALECNVEVEAMIKAMKRSA